MNQQENNKYNRNTVFQWSVSSQDVTMILSFEAVDKV